MDSQPGPPPGDAGTEEEQRLPVNTNPAFLVQGFYDVIGMVESYGWFLLALVFALLFLIYKLRPYLERVQHQREERDYYKKFDAGTVLKRQEAMEVARQKLQEEHDRKAAEYAAAQQEREEKKRQERIDDWDRHLEGKGYRSKVKTPDTTPSASGSSTSSGKKPKKPLRDPDYNPLMGASGGACYRPARRGGAGGGG